MKNRLGILVLLALFCAFSIGAQVISGNLINYGVYTIKSLTDAHYVQVAGDTLYNEKYKDNALIVQHAAENNEEAKPQKYQRWHIIYFSTENEVKYYSIRNTMSGKLLDVPSASLLGGVQLQQSAENTIIDNRMLWSLTEVSAGKYKITNKNSGLAITNQNALTMNNTPITQDVFSGTDSQLWEIIKQEPCSYRDDKVVKFFERNKMTFGSVAFDQGSSIALSDGKTLWVTQDSWDGSQLQSNNLFYSSWFFMYGNSMFLQPSLTDWSPDNAPNITRLNSAQARPKQICDIQPNQSFAWPSNGIEINGKVYLSCGEGNGLTQTKQTLYEIYPLALGSLSWGSIRHEVTGLSNYNTVNYASGMVKASDGYVYVFGSRGLGYGYYIQIFVARFSQASPLDTWTFWNGTSWINTPPTTDSEFTKAKIFEGLGASATVGYVNGKYVLITLDQGFWATTSRFVRGTIANSPTSGFASSKKIYAINEYIYGSQARYYTPNIHPQFKNENDELLFTYSLNYSAVDNKDITVNSAGAKIVNGTSVVNGAYIDPYFYRVKGVRVPYSVLGIPSKSSLTSAPVVEEAKEHIDLFPNPAKESINISSETSLDGATCKIFNTMGSLMKTGKLKESNVSIQTLPAGFYILVIKRNKTFITKTFTKIN
jgi:hypothetical protein